jgi:predicted cobalt transporter CbtA
LATVTGMVLIQFHAIQVFKVYLPVILMLTSHLVGLPHSKQFSHQNSVCVCCFLRLSLTSAQKWSKCN